VELLVHGRSLRFRPRAQLSPSRNGDRPQKRRKFAPSNANQTVEATFLRYATRSERFLRVERETVVWRDGAVHSVPNTDTSMSISLCGRAAS